MLLPKSYHSFFGSVSLVGFKKWCNNEKLHRKRLFYSPGYTGFYQKGKNRLSMANLNDFNMVGAGLDFK